MALRDDLLHALELARDRLIVEADAVTALLETSCDVPAALAAFPFLGSLRSLMAAACRSARAVAGAVDSVAELRTRRDAVLTMVAAIEGLAERIFAAPDDRLPRFVEPVRDAVRAASSVSVATTLGDDLTELARTVADDARRVVGAGAGIGAAVAAALLLLALTGRR